MKSVMLPQAESVGRSAGSMTVDVVRAGVTPSRAAGIHLAIHLAEDSVRGTRRSRRAMYWGAGTSLGEACHDSIGPRPPHVLLPGRPVLRGLRDLDPGTEPEFKCCDSRGLLPEGGWGSGEPNQEHPRQLPDDLQHGRQDPIRQGLHRGHLKECRQEDHGRARHVLEQQGCGDGYYRRRERLAEVSVGRNMAHAPYRVPTRTRGSVQRLKLSVPRGQVKAGSGTKGAAPGCPKPHPQGASEPLESSGTGWGIPVVWVQAYSAILERETPPQLTCAEPGLLSTRQGEIDTVLSIAAYQRFIPTAQGGAGGRRRDDTRGTLTRCSHRGSRNL